MPDITSSPVPASRYKRLDALGASPAAVSAAREVLEHAAALGLSSPGLFYLEPGGVHLQWSSPTAVMEIEVSFRGRFSVFVTQRYRDSCIDFDTDDISGVREFLNGAATGLRKNGL